MIPIVLKIIRQRYKNCANRQIFSQKMARFEAGRYANRALLTTVLWIQKHCKDTKLLGFTQIRAVDNILFY